MAAVPDKLKVDPIFQAIFEVRFSSRDLPEVVVGKLAAQSRWRGWSPQRLAVADIPPAVRHQDPTLQYEALMELRGHNRLVRIGDRSLSCHALAPYPGWEEWEPELISVIALLYASLEDFAATRFGFRYINAITPDHFIKDTTDLRLAIQVAGTDLTGPLLLNYQRRHDDNHIALVRIASRELVTNPQPSNLSAIVDIDLATPASFRSTDPNDAVAWVKKAHDYVKEEFFRLLKEETIEKLRED